MNLHEIYLKHRLGQGQRGQGGQREEDNPALYFLGEILALKDRSPEELEEIHRAKLAYPGARLIQDGSQRATKKLSEPLNTELGVLGVGEGASLNKMGTEKQKGNNLRERSKGRF